MKTFLVAPVRGVDPKAHQDIVSALESSGMTVHWPARDTDQNDNTGLRICRSNCEAIGSSDMVHVIWDGKSQGCLFDIGIAFALKKKIIPLSLPGTTDCKSFQNMIRAWARES